MKLRNADLHVYLDRDARWRCRVQMTVSGEPVSFYVPPRTDPGIERAHGLVPLFLRVIEQLKEHAG